MYPRILEKIQTPNSQGKNIKLEWKPKPNPRSAGENLVLNNNIIVGTYYWDIGGPGFRMQTYLPGVPFSASEKRLFRPDALYDLKQGLIDYTNRWFDSLNKGD